MEQTLRVGDRLRTFTVLGDPGGGAGRPLLLVLHGSKQDGAKHRRFTGGMYDALAEGGRAVVAYLDGYRGNWNDAREQSFFPARAEEVDDVAFVRAVVDDVVRRWGADPERVVVVGYSNGGQMVFRLLHECPGLFSGAAVVAATMPDPESFRSSVPRPDAINVPVVLANGTRDRIAAYGGGSMNQLLQHLFKVGGSGLSAPSTARYLAERNGITTTPDVLRIRDVERTEYAAPGRAPVTLLTLHGAGHTVPGPRSAPFVLGRTSHEVSMADEVALLLGIDGVGPTGHAQDAPA